MNNIIIVNFLILYYLMGELHFGIWLYIKSVVLK